MGFVMALEENLKGLLGRVSQGAVELHDGEKFLERMYKNLKGFVDDEQQRRGGDAQEAL